MPIPEPKKDESQDDFMERCMHEASKNPDRSNDQNVAICMQAWRDAKKEQKTDSKFTQPDICKNMNTFKTLAEARNAYDQLAMRLAEFEQKEAEMTDLEAELAESKAFGSAMATENENFRLLIVEKDKEISGLKEEIIGFQVENAALSGQISELKTELELAQKNQKTARIHARELVAASGGAPIAVDQAEINRMQAGDEKEYLAQMAKTSDSTELNRLYKEYNRIFRPNGKQKKT